MALKSTAVTVADTATRLDAEATSTTSRPAQSVSVYNNDATETLYIGDEDVTTSTGTPVAAGEHYAVDLGAGEQLYGIVAAGTLNARVIETGV